MIRFLQFKFLFLFFLLLSQTSLAQTVDNSENPEKENTIPVYNAGFKTLSGVNNRIDKESLNSIQSNSVISNNEISSSNNASIFLIEGNKEKEVGLFDYNQMPFDVQKKIDLNKATRKILLDGIAKAFTVEIKSCTNSVSTKTILGFLNKDIRFLNTEFVSPGIVRLNVINSFDSVELKELMLGAGISFNFLNEFYFIKD